MKIIGTPYGIKIEITALPLYTLLQFNSFSDAKSRKTPLANFHACSVIVLKNGIIHTYF